MNTLHFLNHPWQQLKILSASPLAQLIQPNEGPELAALLARVGVFRPWPPGARNADRLPQVRACMLMPGQGPRSRFSDGTFRVVYMAKARATCLAEVAYHHGRALRDSGEPPGAARIFEALDLRTSGTCLDVRKGRGDLHHRDDYGPSQAFGRECKASREKGILYGSVRHKEGECLALLDGRMVNACSLKEIIALRWDGDRLS